MTDTGTGKRPDGRVRILPFEISTTHAVPFGTCHKCFQVVYAGLVHHCPTALPWKDLSLLGGGPKP